jgi:hypothetical protein
MGDTPYPRSLRCPGESRHPCTSASASCSMPSTPPPPSPSSAGADGISRKTGYKWLDRYTRLGPDSLADRSHRPQQCPHATVPAVIREILQLRKAWRWGARKLRELRELRELLLEAHPAAEIPATATIHRILVRHGRVRRRRRSQVRAHPGRSQTPITGPHVVWSVDFKGPVPPGQWALLLSAHGAGCLLSLLARL